jgi:hypothetical protein
MSKKGSSTTSNWLKSLKSISNKSIDVLGTGYGLFGSLTPNIFNVITKKQKEKKLKSMRGKLINPWIPFWFYLSLSSPSSNNKSR